MCCLPASVTTSQWLDRLEVLQPQLLSTISDLFPKTQFLGTYPHLSQRIQTRYIMEEQVRIKSANGYLHDSFPLWRIAHVRFGRDKLRVISPQIFGALQKLRAELRKQCATIDDGIRQAWFHYLSFMIQTAENPHLQNYGSTCLWHVWCLMFNVLWTLPPTLSELQFMARKINPAMLTKFSWLAVTQSGHDFTQQLGWKREKALTRFASGSSRTAPSIFLAVSRTCHVHNSDHTVTGKKPLHSLCSWISD